MFPLGLMKAPRMMKAPPLPKIRQRIADRYPRLAEHLRDRTLTADEARSFYDHFGHRQDWQAFYENPALDEMMAHLELRRAQGVLEFGCGTGRLAEILLKEHLPDDARYRGFDVSRTMMELTRQRIAPFAARAEVHQSDGSTRLRVESESFDRLISTYVLDLLSDEDMASFFEEAYRTLVRGGLMGLVSLTHGYTTSAQLLQDLWVAAYRLNPAWVGGCRPIQLLDHLPAGGWRVHYHRVITSYFISSEILIARRT